MSEKRYPVTDSGEEILDPEDGFIIQGNIYVAQLDEKGKPNGGLVGGGSWLFDIGEAFVEDKVPTTIMTKAELLLALGYTVEELEAIIAEKRGREIQQASLLRTLEEANEDIFQNTVRGGKPDPAVGEALKWIEDNSVPCDKCEGSGYISCDLGSIDCSWCKGSGRVDKKTEQK